MATHFFIFAWRIPAGNSLDSGGVCLIIGEFTQEKSLSIAVNVGKSSSTNVSLFSTKESTLEKDPMSVRNVGKPMPARIHLSSTKKSTLERNLISAVNVGSSSCTEINSLCTRESTLEKSLLCLAPTIQGHGLAPGGASSLPGLV